MFLKKSLLTVLFLVSFSKTEAQKLELGKVSIEELQEKKHPKDSSAVAAILFQKGKVTYEYSDSEGFTRVFEVQTRIKVYKKEGYEWANQSVRNYIGSNKESVSITDAITYNLVDGKIEKTKLKSDGIFDEKINKYWGQKKISMPNVKTGSIIEFEYTVRSPFWRTRDWAFQSSIPVNYSEFKTFIPEYFIFNNSQRGFIFPKVTEEKNQKTVHYVAAYDEKNGSKVEHSNETLNYQETKTTYIAENLPALKDEGYVNNIDNYTSSLVQDLSMTKYPNSPLKAYSTDWNAVAKSIYEYPDFGEELNKTGYFDDDINKVIAGLSSQNEKIAAIYNYVKTSVKWNDYTGYSCNDGVKKAYKDKTGNVAEINLMLTAMLRYAGITANPVLVSTRDNGITLFPSTSAYNYVIAGVETTNGMILLDATEKYATPNVLPYRDLNWFGRLIRKDGTSEEIDLMPKTLSRETANISFVINPEGTINGKIRKQFSEQEALKFRKKNMTISTENYLEKLENENNAIEISDYARENETDLSKSISETFSFKDTKSFEKIDNKIYISPLLFLTTKENPFKQETREYPIDFGYPTEEKYNVSFEIPEGYTIETVPTALNIAMPEGLGSFKYVIAQTDKKIQLVVSTTINTAIVPADYYDVLKAFYKQVVDKQNEKIVLKKI